MGTPFAHQQRQPKVGMDCIGSVLVCSWLIGETTDDFRSYGEEPKWELLVNETAKRAVNIRVDQALPADFFIFWTNDHTRRPRHYGILGYNRMLLHTDRRLRGFTAQMIDEWEPRIHSAWRFKTINQLG